MRVKSDRLPVNNLKQGLFSKVGWLYITRINWESEEIKFGEELGTPAQSTQGGHENSRDHAPALWASL